MKPLETFVATDARAPLRAPLPPARPARQRLDARALIASKPGPTPAAAAALARLEQHGGAKLRLPKVSGDALAAVTLNTAGGLTGDDRIDWRASAGSGSRLTLASAACEKVYRTHGPPAHQTTRLDVETGARLDWLPQETIVFDGARLHRTLDATLAPRARLLVAEALVLGRQCSGERLARVEIRDRWRVRGPDGRLLHAEDLRLGDGWPQAADGPGTLGGAVAMATVLYCEDAPPESLARLADTLHTVIDTSPAPGSGGVSALDGRLVIRLVAPSGFALRRTLLPCLVALQDGHALPRVWHV